MEVDGSEGKEYTQKCFTCNIFTLENYNNIKAFNLKVEIRCTAKKGVLLNSVYVVKKWLDKKNKGEF